MTSPSGAGQHEPQLLRVNPVRILLIQRNVLVLLWAVRLAVGLLLMLAAEML